MFSPIPITDFNFQSFLLSSADAFNLDQFKNLLFGKKLKQAEMTNF